MDPSAHRQDGLLRQVFDRSLAWLIMEDGHVEQVAPRQGHTNIKDLIGRPAFK